MVISTSLNIHNNLVQFLTEVLNYTPVLDIDVLITTGTYITVKCNVCGTTSTKQRVAKFQAMWKRYQTRSCNECNKNLLATQKQQTVINAMNRVSREFGLYPINVSAVTDLLKPIQFKATDCGHAFTTSLGSIITNKITCTPCSKAAAIALKREKGELQREATKHNHPTLAGYQKLVRSMTEASWRRYQSIINPTGLTRSHAKLKTGYQLDHIIPTRLGYDLRIAPEIIASPLNLHMLDWKLNLTLQEYFPKKVETCPDIINRVHGIIAAFPGIIQIVQDNITVTEEYACSDYYKTFPFITHTTK